MLADGKLLLFMGDGCREMGKNGKEDRRNPEYVLFDALDPVTGERLALPGEASAAGDGGRGPDPAVAEFGGKRGVLFSGNRKLIALDIAEGTPVGSSSA